MPWALLLDPRVLLGIALIATGLYAAVQRLQKEHVEAEYAQFRADVESEAAKAKVSAAQESLRRSENAQEVVSDLQNRYAALNARYRVLRANSGGSPVPAVPSASAGAQTCPSGQPHAALGHVPEGACLAAIEAGDRELAKYRELWRLQEKNSANRL